MCKPGTITWDGNCHDQLEMSLLTYELLRKKLEIPRPTMTISVNYLVMMFSLILHSPSSIYCPLVRALRIGP